MRGGLRATCHSINSISAVTDNLQVNQGEHLVKSLAAYNTADVFPTLFQNEAIL